MEHLDIMISLTNNIVFHENFSTNVLKGNRHL